MTESLHLWTTFWCQFRGRAWVFRCCQLGGGWAVTPTPVGDVQLRRFMHSCSARCSVLVPSRNCSHLTSPLFVTCVT